MDEMQMVGLGAAVAVVLGGTLYFALKGQSKGAVTTNPHPVISWARIPKARLCVGPWAVRCEQPLFRYTGVLALSDPACWAGGRFSWTRRGRRCR